MKQPTYAKIFKGLRSQLVTFGLFGLVLLVLRAFFQTEWLIFAFAACALYCLGLFLGMVGIWILDRRN